MPKNYISHPCQHNMTLVHNVMDTVDYRCLDLTPTKILVQGMDLRPLVNISIDLYNKTPFSHTSGVKIVGDSTLGSWWCRSMSTLRAKCLTTNHCCKNGSYEH